MVGTLAWASLNAYNGIGRSAFWGDGVDVLIHHQTKNPKRRSRVTRFHSLPFPQELAMEQTLPCWHCRSSHASNYVKNAIMEQSPTLWRDTLQHLDKLLDYARHLAFVEPMTWILVRYLWAWVQKMLLIVTNTDLKPVIAKESPAASGDLVFCSNWHANISRRRYFQRGQPFFICQIYHYLESPGKHSFAQPSFCRRK